MDAASRHFKSMFGNYERYNKCRLVPYSPTTHEELNDKSKTLLSLPMNLNLSEFVVYEKKNVYVQHANLHSAPQLLRLQVYTLQTLPAVF